MYPAPPSAIKNTANQRARKPLPILRYAKGRIHEKNPSVLRGLQIFPPKVSGAALASWNFSVNNQKTEEENPSFSLNLDFLESQVEEENEIEQCKTMV